MFTLEAIDNNTVYERDETLVLELSADGEAVDLGVTRRVVTIQDNDPTPNIGFVGEISPFVNEGGTVKIPVRVVGPASYPQTLDFAARVSPQEGPDHSEASFIGNIIPANSRGKRFDYYLRSNPDDIYEGTERYHFELILRDDNGVVQDRYNGFVDIIDEEPIPTLSLDPVEDVTEGGVFTVTVRLSTPVGFDLPITELRYVSAGSTAEMADYVVPESLQTGELMIAAGMTTAVVTFQTRPDGIYEGTETLVLRPYALSGGQSLNLEGAVSEVTIRDAETRPTVSLDSPGQVDEGGSITVIARLDGVLESTATVELVPTNGNAESDDYTISPTKVTILPGDRDAEFTLTARADIIPTFETIETLTLHPVAIIVEGSVSLDTDSSSVPHEVMISESLPVPEVILGVQGPSGFDEDQRGIQIEASVQPLTEFTVTVMLSRRADSTAVDTDFELDASTLEIDPDIGSVFFNLDIIDDVFYELIETLNFEGYATGGGIELPVQALETTIIDNDPLPTLSLDGPTEINEGDVFTITVRLSHEIQDIDVLIQDLFPIHTGTAGRSDFSPVTVYGGTGQIRAGDTTVDLIFRAIQDEVYEGTETLVLRPTGFVSGAFESLDAVSSEIIIIDDDYVEIGFDQSAYSVDEDSGTLILTARLLSGTLAPGVDLLVDYATRDGSAYAGTDYTTNEGTLLFNSVTLSRQITIAVIDDVISEGGENLTVELTTPVSYPRVTLAPSEATVLIVDNEGAPVLRAPVLRIVPIMPVTEGETLTVEVVLDYVSDATVTVTLEDALSGNAKAGDDYTLPGMLTATIAVGDLTATFRIATLSDELYEGAETLDLLASTGVVAGIAESRATILDEDVAPRVIFDQRSSRVAEGLTVSVLVVLEGSLSESEIVVDFTVSGTAIEGTDYHTLGRSVTIPSGSVTGTVMLSTIDDSDDMSEMVVLVLTGASGGVTLGESVTHTVTIIDDDEAPPVVLDVIATLSVDSVTLNEGESEQFEIRLTGAASSDLTFTLDYVPGGSAQEGDYRLSPTLIVIGAGADRVEVAVTAVDDSVTEGEEIFMLRLNTVSAGVAIAPTNSITVTISENDQPEIVSGVEVLTATLSRDSVTLSEGGSVALEIVLTEVASSDLTFTLTQISGIAQLDSDYGLSLNPLEIVIGAGADMVEVEVTVVDDRDVEGEENFVLELNVVSRGVAIAPIGSIRVTIIDNDEEPPVVVDVTATLSVESVTLNEGESEQVEIRLTEVASSDLTFTLDYVPGGSAQEGDYRLSPTLIVIGAGADRVDGSGYSCG